MKRLSLLIFLLCGCTKGPNASLVQKTLQDKLNQRFQNGLFNITSFTRRGSFTYEEEGPRVFVYYKAQITLLKNYKFTRWDELGTGSLISLLGSTPNGVKGVLVDGNKKGDVLEIHGGVNFKEAGGTWAVSPFKRGQKGDKGKKPVFVNNMSAEDALNESMTSPHKRYLMEIGHLTKRLKVSDLHQLELNLKTLHLETELKADHKKGYVGLGSGDPSGDYALLGQAFEKTLKDQKFKAYETFGTAQNSQLVATAGLVFGFGQGDVLTGEKDLRGLLALYPEAIHVMTLKGNPLHTVSDLRGRKVNIGPPGSGSRKNAVEVLDTHGIDDVLFSSFELERALKELAEGRIDAMIFTAAFPTARLQRFASQTDIKLLPFGVSARKKLLKLNKIKIKVPQNIYPGVVADYHTVGTTSLLFTHRETSDKVVTDTLTALFSQQESLGTMAPKALQFSKAQWKKGMRLPPHPAALKFFER